MMKINKTREEFCRALRPAISQLGGASLEARANAIIAALDLEFEGDELQTPDRIEAVKINDVWTFKPSGVPWVDHHRFPREQEEPLCRAAVGRYNAVTVLTNWLEHQNRHYGSTVEVRRVLEVLADAIAVEGEED